jgi:7,8-dihydropterin-6-yl-methyl-4-(beta-D-ribofuranosyl)aminobenzene 5'-phosphate synthase
VKIINTKEPQLFVSNLAYVTGEIPRNTDFEKGLKNSRIYKNNSWQSDPLIMDERALIFNVKSKGLVVISGCAHSGIINTVQYAQQITGTPKVYAIIGGFHLAGKTFEKRIKPTMEQLIKVNPELIIASHCTGWRALHAIQENLPNAFVHNSVGNLYVL